jgi:membrane-associated HD superfamily phosphohydrolase
VCSTFINDRNVKSLKNTRYGRQLVQTVYKIEIQCYDLGVRDKIIDCLYVYLLYFLCATHDLLFLFSCYSICDACAAVWVAQRVCVNEWTIIYISGIVIANIYCMYIVIIYGKVCMVKNKIKFVLIVSELFYVFLKSLCFYPMEIGVLQLMEEITWKRNETVTHMRNINYTQVAGYMAESINTLFVMSRGKGKQA